MASDSVPFDEIARADLVIDRVYESGPGVGADSDPLHEMFGVANMGGFRYRGSLKGDLRLLVLYSDGVQPDWPDYLDPTTGDFTYYGDNRKPGRDLLAPRGNRVLDVIFAASRGSAEDRAGIPPILFFEKAGPKGRSVRFRGLLAPGSHHLAPEEELVAVWRTTSDKRFQNYRSHFTALDAGKISREWIDDRLAGVTESPATPGAWRSWVRSRIYLPLVAPRTVVTRSVAEQYPTGASAAKDMEILDCVHEHFAAYENWTGFEHFAADIWLMQDPRVESIDVTRPTRDGGRDGVGTYLMGPASDPIRLSFALEAKCYKPRGGGVGVRHVARLVSRIKDREFGVFVTTSHIADQAYQEVREDDHPIVFITGRDIVDILKSKGLRTVEEVRRHLVETYPRDSSHAAAGTGVDYIDEGETVAVSDELPPHQHAFAPEGHSTSTSLG